MRTTRRLAATAAAIAVIAGLVGSQTAFAQSTSSSAAHKKVRLVIGETNNINTLNPLIGLESPEYEVYALSYDLLFNFSDKDLSPVPTGLATEIPTVENGGISSDGLTYTINIREGATWSDGEPLTAHDIAFTYNYILDNNFSNFTNYFPFTDSITAPDDTTLVWKTTKPSIAPLIPPWVYILPEHIWGDLDKQEAKKFANFPDMVTSGPFHIVEWKKDELWRLEANPNYYGGAPKVDEVVFKFYTNAETMVQDLQSGEIDFAESIPVDLFRTLQNADGITAVVGAATTFTQMTLNDCNASDPNAAPYCKKNPGTGNPALFDPDVRTAIAMAIDKDALVSRVLGGYGTVGTTIVPPAFAFWHTEPDNPITFDIDGANALLDQAGYTDTDGNGIRNMKGGGDDLKFRFILRSEDSDSPRYGKLITGWLNQIGIATQPVSFNDGKLINAWYDDDYDMYVWGWGPDPDPDFILSTFTSGQCGSWSDTCYSNPEYDQLYTDQQSPDSRDQRKQIVDQMQNMIYDDIPEIVLFYSNDLQAYRSDRWTGWVPQPTPDANGEGGSLLFQYGNYSYLNVHPVTGGGGATSGGSSGISSGVWIAIIAAIIVIGGGLALMRRRRSDEDLA
jgi:peptide/nickel transport system substrate-binding protein